MHPLDFRLKAHVGMSDFEQLDVDGSDLVLEGLDDGFPVDILPIVVMSVSFRL